MSIHRALANDVNDDWKDAQDWVRKIKELSYFLETTVTILWIPSHCGCEGNEEADRLAEEGTKLEQSEVPITFAIAKARVNKRSWSVTHERAADMYQGRKRPKFEIERNWPVKVRSLYQRLRTDHCKELGHYNTRSRQPTIHTVSVEKSKISSIYFTTAPSLNRQGKVCSESR